MRPTRAPADGPVSGATADALFADGGRLGALCRSLDWSRTPLGPVEGWSQSLRTTVATVLRSRHPMFLFWGPELVQIYNDGYRPSLGEGGRHPQALGMRGADFWIEIWDIIGPQLEAVMHRGEATWHEDQLVAIERNGRIEEVYWTYSYSPVRDDDGSIGGALVVCQETTPRVIAERRLRTLHRMAALPPRGRPREAAAEAARILAADALDAPFVLCYLAPGARETGPIERVYAAGLSVEAPPDRWPLEQAMETRQPVLVDLEEDATTEGVGPWPEPPASAVVLPLVSADGTRVLGAMVVGLSARLPWSGDYREFLVTAASHVWAKAWSRRLDEERARHDRELEVERSRLAYVFEQAPAFLAVLRGPEHTFEMVNDAYYQVVGRRTLIGKPVLEALPEIRGQGFVELLDRVMETGKPFIGREVPVELTRDAGSAPEERYLDFVYTPLVEADGSTSGIIAHGTDVTAQVHARREVERLLGESEAARAEAEAANHAKTRFLANMSHELRTPINAVMGYTDLLEMGVHGELTAEQRSVLERINASSHHLMGLVNDILDVSSIEAGGISLTRRPVPLALTVGEALDLVRPDARTKGVDLVSEGPCGEEVSYMGDPDRGRQVLVNLLSNAIKFTPTGGRIVVRCDIREEGPVEEPHRGPWVVIEVEDTGVGIPEDDMDRIFDPFVQVDDSDTRPAGGAGLGLAISKQLALIMQGDLTVRSRPAEGTCFTLWLPRGD